MKALGKWRHQGISIDLIAKKTTNEMGNNNLYISHLHFCRQQFDPR